MESNEEVIKSTEVKVQGIAEPISVDTDYVDTDMTTPDSTTVVESAVVKSAVVELIQIIGIPSISETSLTDEQKKLATQIYDSTKAAIQGFINDASLNNTVKVTKTLGQVIKQLETAKVDGTKASGNDKKAVAIQIGRILIKEVTPDDKGEAEILMMYDLVAEPTLEAMIEVSRVVNVAVQELATKCCPNLFNLFKLAKKSLCK